MAVTDAEIATPAHKPVDQHAKLALDAANVAATRKKLNYQRMTLIKLNKLNAWKGE